MELTAQLTISSWLFIRALAPYAISAGSAETFSFKYTRRRASPTTESRSPHHIPYVPGARDVLAEALYLSSVTLLSHASPRLASLLALSSLASLLGSFFILASLLSFPRFSPLPSSLVSSPCLASLLDIQISRGSIHQRQPWPRVFVIVVGCIYSWNDGVPLMRRYYYTPA